MALEQDRFILLLDIHTHMKNSLRSAAIIVSVHTYTNKEKQRIREY